LRGYEQDTVMISINSKCDRYYLAQNISYHPLSNMLKQINFSFVFMVVEHGPWSTIWGFHKHEDFFFCIWWVTEITGSSYLPRFGLQLLDYMVSQPRKPPYESSTVLKKEHTCQENRLQEKRIWWVIILRYNTTRNSETH
jgi:hypothetical protein